jgi:hypothetical protein
LSFNILRASMPYSAPDKVQLARESEAQAMVPKVKERE